MFVAILSNLLSMLRLQKFTNLNPLVRGVKRLALNADEC